MTSSMITQQDYSKSYVKPAVQTKTTRGGSEAKEDFEAVFNSKSENETASYEEMINIIKRTHAQIYEKIKNGETEPTYQIGATSFTEKEWDKLIEKIDESIEDIKEAVKESIEDIKENSETLAAVSKEQIQQLLIDRDELSDN